MASVQHEERRGIVRINSVLEQNCPSGGSLHGQKVERGRHRMALEEPDPSAAQMTLAVVDDDSILSGVQGRFSSDS